MALARLVTFVPLTLIKSADVNGELNNILSNPIALVSPTTGPINFNLQLHQNLVPSAITASSASAGQAVIATTSGGTQFGTPTGTIAQSGSNVKGLLGTLTSQTGTFSADQYLLQTTDGKSSFVLNSTASFTVNLGTAGPAVNGRDIAGAFASTYVHWYAITTGLNSTTPAGLVSSNPPTIGPVALPTSYSAFSYLGGSAYTSASTTLLQNHRFRGALATYDASPNVLSGGSAVTETYITLSSVLPVNALSYTLGGFGSIVFNSAGDGTAIVYFGNVAGSTYKAVQVALSGLGAAHTYNVPIPDITFPNLGTSGPFFQWASAGTLTMALQSYRMPNGDSE